MWLLHCVCALHAMREIIARKRNHCSKTRELCNACTMRAQYVRNTSLRAQHRDAEQWKAVKSAMIAYAMRAMRALHASHFLNKILFAHKSLPAQCTHSFTRNAEQCERNARIHLHTLPSNGNAMRAYKQCARITKIVSNGCAHCRAMHALNACIARIHCAKKFRTLCYIRF